VRLVRSIIARVSAPLPSGSERGELRLSKVRNRRAELEPEVWADGHIRESKVVSQSY